MYGAEKNLLYFPITFVLCYNPVRQGKYILLPSSHFTGEKTNS